MDLSLHLTILTTTGLFQAIAGVVRANNVSNARYFKPGLPLEVSCSAAMFDMSEVEQVTSITLCRLQPTTNVTEEMYSIYFKGNTVQSIKEGRTDGTWLYNFSSKPSAERVDVKVLHATKEDNGIYGCRISILFQGRKETMEKWERLYCKDDMSDSQGNHSTAGIVAGVLAVLVVVVVAITVGLFRKRRHPSHRVVESTNSTHKKESQLVMPEQETIGQTLQDGCHSYDLPSESSLNLDRRQDDNDFSKHFISGPRDAGIYSTDKKKSQLMTELATIGPIPQECCQVNEPPSDPELHFDTRQENKSAFSKPSDNRDTTLRTTSILCDTRQENNDPLLSTESDFPTVPGTNVSTTETEQSYRVKVVTRRPLKPKRAQLNCHTSPNLFGIYSADEKKSQLKQSGEETIRLMPPEVSPSNDQHSESSLKLDDKNESDFETVSGTKGTSTEYLHALLVVPRKPLGPPRRKRTKQRSSNTSPNISSV